MYLFISMFVSTIKGTENRNVWHHFAIALLGECERAHLIVLMCKPHTIRAEAVLIGDSMP